MTVPPSRPWPGLGPRTAADPSTRVRPRPAPRSSTQRRLGRPTTRSRRARLGLATLAFVLLGAGASAVVIAERAQRAAPQPPPAAAGTYGLSTTAPPTTGASGTAGSHTIGPTVHGPILARSRPVTLRIPSIGVDASLIQLGLNRDRTVQVPPLSAHSVPGWYRYSPTPGALGPAVILGHVDSASYGPGVFFRLGALRKGDTVDVTLADHEVAVFRVEAVASYPKDHFPTLTVYGDTDHAALRLITCGGSFDSVSGNYRDNIVAFASLVGSHRA